MQSYMYLEVHNIIHSTILASPKLKRIIQFLHNTSKHKFLLRNTSDY